MKSRLTLIIIGFILFSATSCFVKGIFNKNQNNTNLNIEFFLAGNISNNRATIAIKSSTSGKIKMDVYDRATNKRVRKSILNFTANSKYIIKQQIEGLKENNSYKYVFKDFSDNLLDSGFFHTLTEKASSFKFVFGSCVETGSESKIFLNIMKENPLFFLQIGDLHYENINSDCLKNFEGAYKKVFSSSTQSELLKYIPFAYMWDDHDFGPNNSDSTNPCRADAISCYKKFIPHYPIDFNSNTGPISQAFSASRVMFILTDLRSQKLKPVYEDCMRIRQGTNFGSEEHLNWFFNALLQAKKTGKVVAWINTYPWINGPGGPNYKCNESDNWGGYPEERQRIANFIKKHQIPVFILSGDAHMVAIDDGSNSDYASGGGWPIPVFHAAALDRPGSYKGGPYSHGYSTASGQYGIVEVIDEGGSEICLNWYARNINSDLVLNQENKEIRYNFCMKLQNP